MWPYSSYNGEYAIINRPRIWITHVNNRQSLINLIQKTRDPNNQTVNKPLTKFSHDCNWILSSLSRKIYLIYFDSCQGIPTKLSTYLICFIHPTNYSYLKLPIKLNSNCRMEWFKIQINVHVCQQRAREKKSRLWLE